MSQQPDEHYSRANESEAQRLDRNYSELLQELRVAQTGVQILFAFLLSIAFQQRFGTVNSFQRGVYLATLLCAAIAAILFIGPVAVHRLLFRKHRKDTLVDITSRFAAAGLAFLLLAILGGVLLIVDFVAGLAPAVVLTAVLAALASWLWWLVPHHRRETAGAAAEEQRQQ